MERAVTGGLDIFIAGLGVMIAGGILAPLLPESWRPTAVALGTVTGSVMVLVPALGVLAGGETAAGTVALSYPAGTVPLVLDRLAAFFAVIFAVVGSLGAVYAVGYLRGYAGGTFPTGSHSFFLPVLVASMLLLLVVQNALAFLIAWEIMSLASFFLVAFDNTRDDVVTASLNYLVAAHVGVLFIIGGFLVMARESGSLDFASFTAVFSGNRAAGYVAFALLFTGFGLKAGFVPLHTWLPLAHPAAPAHVSGLMSGIMIKTGIYGILRVLLMAGKPDPVLGFAVLGISLLTAFTGIAQAVMQRNLKRILAYSSIENIGIAGTGIGVGLLGLAYDLGPVALLGFSGALLHVMNHAVIKSLLFFVTGSVYRKTHTYDIELLGGLGKTMPATAAAFLVASLAISALPPLSGFAGEFFIYWGMVQGLRGGGIVMGLAMAASFAVLAFFGGLALLCFTRAFGMVFLGHARGEHHESPGDASRVELVAFALLGAVIVVSGLLPQYLFVLVYPVAGMFTAEHGILPDPGNIPGVLEDLSYALAGLTALVLVVLAVRRVLLAGRPVAGFRTWDCGYQAGTARMQYTGSSFSAPMVRVISLLSRYTRGGESPAGPFPERASYAGEAEDRFHRAILIRMVALVERGLNTFTWIQSGSTQRYILYGLVFLIVMAVWIMVA